MAQSRLAIVSMACFLAALPGCRKDKGTDEDTSTDTQDEDTAVDNVLDTVEDTVEDTAGDTVEDTAEDTAEDTPVDTSVDTSTDTPEDTPEDTPVDIPVDTSVDTSVDTLVDTSVDVVDVDGDEVTTPGGLLFSEYVEGSSNNKAVEIYNAGSTAFDLGLCSVRIYSNGSSTVTTSITLTTVSLAADDVYVLCNSAASFSSTCDQTHGSVNFNGDDAVELFCDGTTRDVIGQIGVDPGVEWGTGLVSTADNTLRRMCSVTLGDTNGSDAFDPSVQWDGYATDTFSGLGDHCP